METEPSFVSLRTLLFKAKMAALKNAKAQAEPSTGLYGYFSPPITQSCIRPLKICFALLLLECETAVSYATS